MDRNKVGLLTLVALLYSQASAGPCGIEQTVGSAGVWLAIASQAGVVLLFSLPQAIISIELNKGVVENGGYALWAERHLGAAWGSAVGLWGAVGGAAYAASLVQNIVQYASLNDNISELAARWPEFGLVAGLTLASVGLCSTSLRNAGVAYSLITLFTVSLFATLNGYAGTHANIRSEPFLPSGTRDFSMLVDLLIFNAPYFDSVAAYAGEARNPARNIPLSIAIVATLVLSTNIVTLLVTYFGLGDPSSTWKGGHFAVVAGRLVGPRMRDAVIANAFISNFQIICSNIQNSSYMVSGMAAHGTAPAWLRAAPGDVPVRAVLLCAFVTVMFGFVNFETSLAVQTVLYTGVLVVECAAYVVKRTNDRAAVEAVGVVVMPALFAAISFYVQDRIMLAAGAGSMLASVALAYALHAGRGRDAATDAFAVRKHRPETDVELDLVRGKKELIS